MPTRPARSAWRAVSAQPGRARLDGAGDPVLRLRAELPGSAAAVDPGQADPGRARRHRRPARPDQRALLRAVLLPARHSGRLARRPDQPGARACPSPARCGARRPWPAACRHNYPQLAAARMSVGVGEAGGVPPSYAIISDYFPPGTRGTALEPLQSRAADRAGAGRRVRRVDRGRLQLALGLRLPRRRRHRHRADRAGCSCASRCAAASMRRRAGAAGAAGAGGVLADLPHVLRAPGAAARVAGQRRDAVRHLRACSTSPRCS